METYSSFENLDLAIVGAPQRNIRQVKTDFKHLEILTQPLKFKSLY